MIIYTYPTNEHPQGYIGAEIGFPNENYNYPLKFQVINTINSKVQWECNDMYPGHWTRWFEPCNAISYLKDSNDKILEVFEWDQSVHGDIIHKKFLDWSKKNQGSKGIAIGTHDGTTGEWVVPVRMGLIDAILVEASDLQFGWLSQNYQNIQNTKLVKSLITKDGSDYVFFESKAGFTNSIIQDHVIKYESDLTSMTSIKMKSKSLNDLIIECGLKNDLRWLHLDVEGIDDELIMSLDDNRIKLPDVIIFESLNLSEERKKIVINWLESKNYECEVFGWNAIAMKKTIDLSLLVHTCDSYEKFWPGMFYSLDFYWNYNYIPVYFANEEKDISEFNIRCKELEYNPNPAIKQILTGKTDKNGFSSRLMDAISKIPTKYVLYIQEDMWLKRSLHDKIIEDLINFMDEVNANSVKLHSRLWYYESYELEPTNYFVGNQRILKDIGTCPMTHNATIWRKDYLLKHMKPNEDPWSNEINGSERMLSDMKNNYHYNIHWYCQPGMSNMGEESEEFNVYAPIIDEMMNMKLKFNL